MPGVEYSTCLTVQDLEYSTVPGVQNRGCNLGSRTCLSSTVTGTSAEKKTKELGYLEEQTSVGDIVLPADWQGACS